MKERPIPFSAPMVRALLAGTKTQTRRICKPAEAAALSFVVGIQDPNDLGQRPLEVAGSGWFGDEEGDIQFRCPYGKPGDRLWVRETWYCDDYRVQSGPYAEVEGAREVLIYRADGERPYEADQPVWRPSIHMPRWASRILLEIVSVRVERLNAISDLDTLAEGCSAQEMRDGDCLASVYARLWESINGAGSWAVNPWVWVVEFRRAKS